MTCRPLNVVEPLFIVLIEFLQDTGRLIEPCVERPGRTCIVYKSG